MAGEHNMGNCVKGSALLGRLRTIALTSGGSCFQAVQACQVGSLHATHPWWCFLRDTVAFESSILSQVTPHPYSYKLLPKIHWLTKPDVGGVFL